MGSFKVVIDITFWFGCDQAYYSPIKTNLQLTCCVKCGGFFLSEAFYLFIYLFFSPFLFLFIYFISVEMKGFDAALYKLLSLLLKRRWCELWNSLQGREIASMARLDVCLGQLFDCKACKWLWTGLAKTRTKCTSKSTRINYEFKRRHTKTQSGDQLLIS